MKRRVIKQGNDTLTITIPRKWAQKHALKAGHEVEVEEQDHALVVHGQGSCRPVRASIHLEEGSELYVYQMLRNLYNSEIEELLITYDSPEVLVAIQKNSVRFLGWEFIEQDGQHCLIKNYAQHNEEHFHELYRNAFTGIRDISSAIQSDLMLGRAPDAARILHIVGTVHRFVNYCRKMLIRKPVFRAAESRAHSHILTDLLVIVSEYAAIAEQLCSRQVQASRQVRAYFQDVAEFFQLFHAFFLQKKTKGLNIFSARGKELQELGIALLKKAGGAGGADAVIIHHLLNINKIVSYHSGRLMVVNKMAEIQPVDID